MNKYAGTQSEKNLMTAFAGESEARNKYTFFASVAKKQGFEQIAALFLKTADNEKEHAKLWFKELNGIGDTADNLKAAADREGTEENGVLFESGATLKQYGSAPIAAADIATGKLDCVVVDELPAKSIAEKNEGYKAVEMTYADGSTTEEEYAFCVAKGNKTLLDAINALYDEFGWYKNDLLSFAFEGESGMHTMQRLMESLRNDPPKAIAGQAVEQVVDYAAAGAGLPQADVLEFRLAGGGKFMVRPSGTEPKIKAYLSAVGESEAAAQAAIGALAGMAHSLLNV